MAAKIDISRKASRSLIGERCIGLSRTVAKSLLINAATVLDLRIAEQTSQSVVSVLEQLIVGNKRQRDAEAKLMNAQLYQWQFGLAYGEDLTRHTAAALDAWRQP